MPPALRAALICESVLTEPDGVHSAIRIFDRVHLAPGDTFEAKLLLMLANTEELATDQLTILMRVENAAAEIVSGTDFAVTSPRQVGDTFSMIVPFRFQAPVHEGVFWLRFSCNTEDQLLARVPLQFRRPVNG